ncbi:MAG: ABC-F family ATP-binding cassette domain-containing protein [Paracoccus sp. (in: a-proteobacteria)]
MPASISLSGLSWSNPDGTPLFTGLTLAFGPECTGIVGRNGTGKSTLLRLIAGDLHPAAGRIDITGSIAMLRQNAMAEARDTIADLFGARSALELLDRAEAGRAGAEELAQACWTLPTQIETALLRVGLDAGPQTPLATLSGGQRSRAALAALILAEPDMLLLDEPTNNLDQAGRQAVTDLIKGWTGGAIIVSHDRELLEAMDAIVELTPLGATRYGGNYTAFRERKDIELQAAARNLAHADKTLTDTARRAQQVTERKARKDGAGHRARAKGGQPKVLMDAAKGRAEASGGSGTRLREARRDAAQTALAEARDRIEVLQPLQMDIPPTGLAPGKLVLRLEGVTGGYPGHARIIRDLSMTVTGPERIVIAGPNGCGKSTLVKLITGQIAPQQGAVQVAVPVAVLDQDVDLLAPAQTLLANFIRQNPQADTRIAHAALARFGFRASDALRLASGLSGGERLRAGLACTLGGTPTPMLLILDEPTNHLDLDAIAALESALTAYDGAMLVVSHDTAFLKVLAPDRVIGLPGPAGD